MKKILFCLASILCGIIGFILGANTICKKMTKNYVRVQESEKRFRNYFDLMIQWMNLKHQGKSLELYLTSEGIRRVAIYGMGKLGEQLLQELKSSRIELAYAIDQNVDGIIEGITIYQPDDRLDEVDAIIVTPTWAFDTISDMMKAKVSCRIISLEDVVFGIE